MMPYLYFPGCKYTAHSPKNSQKLQEYIQQRFDMPITGCCSADYKRLEAADTAVFVCPTCSAILEESAPQSSRLSVWELLLNDDQFPWPDYHGRSITIQDCWRTHDNRAMQDAIRGVLSLMNVDVVEIENAYDKANYCGISLLKPQSLRYKKLAPVRFIERAGDKFQTASEEEQRQQMENHCTQYQTDVVACYCTGCLEGLAIGGVEGVHLMDLVMGDD